jgi:predicted amidophosphoribosyltransferase
MAEMPCPNCGAEIDPAADERCPSCDIPLQVVCANCGAQVPATDDECPECGTLLTHASQST